MATTQESATVLTCEHEDCGCRVQIQVPCGCEGSDQGSYVCACGADLVPVTGT